MDLSFVLLNPCVHILIAFCGLYIYFFNLYYQLPLPSRHREMKLHVGVSAAALAGLILLCLLLINLTVVSFIPPQFNLGPLALGLHWAAAAVLQAMATWLIYVQLVNAATRLRAIPTTWKGRLLVLFSFSITGVVMAVSLHHTVLITQNILRACLGGKSGSQSLTW